MIALIHYRENGDDYAKGIFGVDLRGGSKLEGIGSMTDNENQIDKQVGNYRLLMAIIGKE